MPTLCISESRKTGALYIDESRKNGSLKVADRRAKKEILIKAIAPTIHALIEENEVKQIKKYFSLMSALEGDISVETQWERADLDVDQIVVIA